MICKNVVYVSDFYNLRHYVCVLMIVNPIKYNGSGRGGIIDMGVNQWQ